VVVTQQETAPDRAIKVHLLNFIGGVGLSAPASAAPETASLLQRARDLYAAYPEIPRGELLPQEVKSDHPGVMAVAYGTTMQMVIAVVNLTPEAVQTTLWVPGLGSVLYDRLEGKHIPLAGGLGWMDLPPYAQLAYELR
jgi:hypothetical protein